MGVFNHYITFSDMVISNMIVSEYGGAFVFYQSNSYINIDHVTMTSCSADNGK